MKGIQHIFFDLDHTLWDFEKNSQETLVELFETYQLYNYIEDFDLFFKKYKEINFQYWDLYQKNEITKESVRFGRFIDTLAFFQIKSDELAKSLAIDYTEIGPWKKNLFPHTKEILTSLVNNYHLHIITNGFKEIQNIKLKESGIADFFKIVLCSEDTGEKKPHPLVFGRAIQLANAKVEESIMIGDDLYADYMGAKNFGMKSILFNPEKVVLTDDIQQINSLSELSTLFNV